ncbi:MAG: Mu transposase domain-containing protein, partial [Egibacteraceae bacterium]
MQAPRTSSPRSTGETQPSPRSTSARRQAATAATDRQKPRKQAEPSKFREHLEFERHYYSVPHQLVGSRVDVRATTTTIEVFHAARRVASHRRDDTPGRHTTDPAHMPVSHRRHAEWSPSRIL